jgi:hypothetical protein
MDGDPRWTRRIRPGRDRCQYPLRQAPSERAAVRPAARRGAGPRPAAFFTVNLVARKPNRNTPDTNPYLKKFLQHPAGSRRLVAVFAGKLNYARYGFLDTQMIRLIMWLTKGPTEQGCGGRLHRLATGRCVRPAVERRFRFRS